MIDVEKQIAYWRKSALEDWTVDRELIVGGRVRHGLFFAHLALEKALKAHVCQQTRDLAPRIHNLVRLAELVGRELTQEQVDVLAEMNAFNIEGRYPESLMPPHTCTGTDLCDPRSGGFPVVDRSVVSAVRSYIQTLQRHGLTVCFGVVFGSYATGKANQWSDIDLLVVSPRFDDQRERRDVDLLWRLAARADSRIEPIPCGERQWQEDDSSAIIEIARREGERIALQP